MPEKRLIMIVDDDENTQTIVRTILLSSGYSVEVCSNGAEALEKLEEIRPSLVILDIMMPEMSGYEVMVRMRQNPLTQNIPAMFLSAKGDPSDLISGYSDYCVEYYITKPFTSQQLLAGVKLIFDSAA